MFTDEDLEALTPEQKANWKGYTYKMAYETWDDEAVECGETDDKGMEVEETEPLRILGLFSSYRCFLLTS